MTWVKLDEGFDENGKIAALSSMARDAFVRALCYCNRSRTDGFIPANKARELAGKPSVIKELTTARRAAPEKEPSVCWEPVDGGYQVHDFLVYQPSRKDLEERDEKNRLLSQERSEAGRKGGLASGESRRRKPAGDHRQLTVDELESRNDRRRELERRAEELTREDVERVKDETFASWAIGSPDYDAAWTPEEMSDGQQDWRTRRLTHEANSKQLSKLPA